MNVRIIQKERGVLKAQVASLLIGLPWVCFTFWVMPIRDFSKYEKEDKNVLLFGLTTGLFGVCSERGCFLRTNAKQRSNEVKRKVPKMMFFRQSYWTQHYQIIK